jgi:hypothetical protein
MEPDATLYRCGDDVMGSRVDNVAIEVNGEEVTARVHYFYQPAELDTGTAAGVEIEQVMVDGEDVLFELTDAETEQLSLTLLDFVGGYHDRF